MSIPLLLVYGVLVKGALEDVRSLAISQDLLLGGWALLAAWEVAEGHALTVLLLLALTVWGMGYGHKMLVWLFLPVYPYWPVLLLAAGAREGRVGEGDVLAVSLVSLLSPWAGVSAFVGMMAWLAWQKKAGKLWVPAMPGILVGLALWGLWSIAVS